MKAMSADGAQATPQAGSEALAAWLLQSAGTGVGAEGVAASVVATCQDIDGALTPIIGPCGVAALFYRSAHLAAQRQPNLAGIHMGTPTAMDLGPLKLQLAGQTPADAAAAGALLLHTFKELLGTLIGPSLTERLLRSVWPVV